MLYKLVIGDFHGDGHMVTKSKVIRGDIDPRKAYQTFLEKYQLDDFLLRDIQDQEKTLKKVFEITKKSYPLDDWYADGNIWKIYLDIVNHAKTRSLFFNKFEYLDLESVNLGGYHIGE